MATPTCCHSGQRHWTPFFPSYTTFAQSASRISLMFKIQNISDHVSTPALVQDTIIVHPDDRHSIAAYLLCLHPPQSILDLAAREILLKHLSDHVIPLSKTLQRFLARSVCNLMKIYTRTYKSILFSSYTKQIQNWRYRF